MFTAQVVADGSSLEAFVIADCGSLTALKNWGRLLLVDGLFDKRCVDHQLDVVLVVVDVVVVVVVVVCPNQSGGGGRDARGEEMSIKRI